MHSGDKRMAMGTRRRRQRQEQIWISHDEVAKGPGHPFYKKVNELLEEAKFDNFAEKECAKFYAANNGRPSVTPGIYFRLLLLGYFEGIDSERGIAWRAGDSLGLREFLGIGLDEQPADHSTISRTRRLIDVETHKKVFSWILEVLRERGLIKGKTVGIDATTLEANAAMRSIVRRDSGESYEEFLTGLAKESGIETPTREDLTRIDKNRKNKASNKDWVNPHERDARIAKMKDGSTHLAHKAEHAVDMETGAVLAVTLQEADQGDTATVQETLLQAGENVAELLVTETEKAPEEKRQVYFQGVKQRVSQQRSAGRYKGYGSPDLYPREKADTATRLGWPEEPNESASATRGDLREPAARWRSVWEEPATEKRRTRGTKFCALLRDRWNEENTSTRAEEYSQALADSRGCLQLESDLSLDVGCWKATGAEEPACFGFFFAFVGHPMVSRDSGIENTSFFDSTTITTTKLSLSPLSAASFE